MLGAVIAFFNLEDLGHSPDHVVVEWFINDLAAIGSIKFVVPVFDAAAVSFLGLVYYFVVFLFVVQDEQVMPVEALFATFDLTLVYFVIVMPSVMLTSVAT